MFGVTSDMTLPRWPFLDWHEHEHVAPAVGVPRSRRLPAPPWRPNCTRLGAELPPLALVRHNLEIPTAVGVLALERDTRNSLLAPSSSLGLIPTIGRAVLGLPQPLLAFGDPRLALKLLTALSARDNDGRAWLGRVNVAGLAFLRAVPPLTRRWHLERGVACEAQTLLVHASHATTLPTRQDSRISVKATGR